MKTKEWIKKRLKKATRNEKINCLFTGRWFSPFWWGYQEALRDVLED